MNINLLKCVVSFKNREWNEYYLTSLDPEDLEDTLNSRHTNYDYYCILIGETDSRELKDMLSGNIGYVRLE